MEDKKEAVGRIEIHVHKGRLLPRQYLNLVRARWMRSYRHNNDYMKLIDSDSYYQAYSKYIMSILGREETIVRLAVLEEDSDVTLGFGVSENTTLHYVEVPTAYRRQGIGGGLVPTDIKWFTHLTKTGIKLWAEKFPQAKFNPFI